MTREEIIDGLKFTVDMFLFDPTTGETYKEPRNDMDKTTIDACNGAIELLLEQESVLDKIRAGLKELPNANSSYWHGGDMVNRNDVLEIIDRYAESEGEEYAK